jgi:hypothetical protein
MDGVTGGIYSGDPGVDSWHLVSHLIPSYHTTIDTLHLSHLLTSLALSETSCGSAQLRGSAQPGSTISSHPLPTLLEPDPLFLTSSFLDAVRGAVDCRRWTLCLLASPFNHKWSPNADLLFGKLSTEWWERPLLANTGKYREKQLVDDTNNVGLERRMW